jgi:hypothetical protein
MFSKKPTNFNMNVFLKAALIMMLDVAATAGSYFLGLWFRYDFSFHDMRVTTGKASFLPLAPGV